MSKTQLLPIYKLTDILLTDPILRPYIEANLGENDNQPKAMLRTILYTLIKDVDMFIFNLFDEILNRVGKEEGDKFRNTMIKFINETSFINEAMNRLMTTQEPQGYLALSHLNNYLKFQNSDNSKNVKFTLFNWKGAGVHFAQLLLVLREEGWIDFPNAKMNETQEQFCKKIYKSILFESAYTLDSLERNLKSDNTYSPNTELRKRYKKTFKGGDFFTIAGNPNKRIRKAKNKKEN